MAKQKILLSSIGQTSAGKNQCSPAKQHCQSIPNPPGLGSACPVQRLPLSCSTDCEFKATRHRGVILHSCTLKHIQNTSGFFMTTALPRYRGLKAAKLKWHSKTNNFLHLSSHLPAASKQVPLHSGSTNPLLTS